MIKAKLSLSGVTLLAMILVSHPNSLNAQHQDSVIHKTNFKKIIGVPAMLIATSLFVTTDNDVFDRYEIEEERNKLTPRFRTHVDDYLQYSPIAVVYALNAMGIRGTHDIANQTAILIKTELLMTAIVLPLKKITAVPRPDTGQPTSFPSGHTAQAFAAATFLYKEYGKEHPWYAVMAYTTASGVGLLRVINNRHWMSDVLAGAGIGILTTNLVYLTHENKWSKKHNKKGIVLAPAYGARTFTLSAVIPVRYHNH